jgi:GT2 family glycosyltransferase
MTFPSVDIVVVTYGNMFADLKRSLDSLYKFTRPPFRVIVVNNACTDETAAYCAALPDCTAVNLPENVGTVRALRAGIAAGSAPFIVRMDHDIELLGPWQEYLFPHFSEGKTGMAGPRILNPDGTIYSALFNWQLRISNIPFHVSVENPLSLPRPLRRFAHINQHSGEKDDDAVFGVARPVHHVTGTFWLMSRAAVEDVGLPDEKYPDLNGAFEDLDYTLRFVTAGLRVIYDGRVRIVHYCSRPAQKAQRPSAPPQNRMLFRKKWGIYA